MGLLLGGVSLLLLLASLALFKRSRKKSMGEALLDRLATEDDESLEQALGRFEKEKIRLGISLPFWLLVVLSVSWFLGLFLVFMLSGVVLSLLAFVCSLLLVCGCLSLRYRRRVKKMVSQLPQMLEHMIRSIRSGRTLGNAVLFAMENAPEPLHSGVGRSQRFVERGGKLDDAMDSFSELYDQEEFKLLALGIRINQRYGGSAVEVLENIVVLIRERETAMAQLRAMTGETRMSALVLGGMPIAMAGYIFISNPDFLLGLWTDATGQFVLLTALALQTLGSFFLWRMLRSI